MRDAIEMIVKSLVDDPETVDVREVEQRNGGVYLVAGPAVEGQNLFQELARLVEISPAVVECNCESVRRRGDDVFIARRAGVIEC